MNSLLTISELAIKHNWSNLNCWSFFWSTSSATRFSDTTNNCFSWPTNFPIKVPSTCDFPVPGGPWTTQLSMEIWSNTANWSTSAGNNKPSGKSSFSGSSVIASPNNDAIDAEGSCCNNASNSFTNS